MFVFGEEGAPSRRFGPVTILVLLVVTAGAVAAVLWSPQPRRQAAPARSAQPAPGCPLGDGLTVSTYADENGEPIDPKALDDYLLRWEADQCGPEVAADPARLQLAASWVVSTQAGKINTGLNAVLCPLPESCSRRRSAAGEDVDVVRAALRKMGYPAAEVRRPQEGDGVPYDSVVYGIPLDRSACLVSYVRMGSGVVSLPPVGRLRTGGCLRPV
ncbi:hypothetical protein JIG36_29020 [Actinoplanes sp. LDG1-06]|uniref:PASTA domain-containing protein n=1 Tax=Paractinoplanes ovalisporus TaxID=2810368 RepID=A0ABS2AIH4_9ACTN|nr:hypothetical protein [Actinoplanes ovalisporus]MBM2619593.1 hypothetical protein [Actinoplanes ovalisporus]